MVRSLLLPLPSRLAGEGGGGGGQQLPGPFLPPYPIPAKQHPIKQQWCQDGAPGVQLHSIFTKVSLIKLIPKTASIKVSLLCKCRFTITPQDTCSF